MIQSQLDVIVTAKKPDVINGTIVVSILPYWYWCDTLFPRTLSIGEAVINTGVNILVVFVVSILH